MVSLVVPIPNSFDTNFSFYFGTSYFILVSVKAATIMVRAAAFHSIFVASQSVHLLNNYRAKNLGAHTLLLKDFIAA